MTEHDFERFLERTAGEYNAPPAPPRDEMWVAIRRGLHGERRGPEREDPLDLGARRSRRARLERLRSWSPWAVVAAAAATLAAGFGLGHISGERSARTGADRLADTPLAEVSPAVRLAAARHMGEAEAMLTFFRASDPGTDQAATADWARQLLMTTRLMLDARAGDDPVLARLLGDLELVLVQIVHAAGDGGATRELIEDGMEQRQLLSKLRTAMSGSLEMAM